MYDGAVVPCVMSVTVAQLTHPNEVARSRRCLRGHRDAASRLPVLGCDNVDEDDDADDARSIEDEDWKKNHKSVVAVTNGVVTSLKVKIFSGHHRTRNRRVNTYHFAGWFFACCLTFVYKVSASH